jgi:hypothetical protein
MIMVGCAAGKTSRGATPATVTQYDVEWLLVRLAEDTPHFGPAEIQHMGLYISSSALLRDFERILGAEDAMAEVRVAEGRRRVLRVRGTAELHRRVEAILDTLRRCKSLSEDYPLLD